MYPNTKLSKIKVGDKVRVECYSGLGTGGVETVTSIKTRYNRITGTPYKIICCGLHCFLRKTGEAYNSPYAYYISGKIK